MYRSTQIGSLPAAPLLPRLLHLTHELLSWSRVLSLSICPTLSFLPSERRSRGLRTCPFFISRDWRRLIRLSRALASPVYFEPSRRSRQSDCSLSIVFGRSCAGLRSGTGPVTSPGRSERFRCVASARLVREYNRFTDGRCNPVGDAASRPSTPIPISLSEGTCSSHRL
jgi:hypothetical protein